MIPKCSGCKDLSDYVKTNGVEKAKSLINEYVKHIRSSE